MTAPITAASRLVLGAATVGTLLFLGALMLAPTLGAQLPPLWPGWLVLVLNLAACGVLLAVSRHGAVTAVFAGAAVGLPFLAALVHTWTGGPANVAPVTAAVAGSATAAAVLAGPVLGAERVLLLVTAIATGVTLLSLLAAAAELVGAPVTASYLPNDRTWLAPWQLRGIAGHPNQLALVGTMALLLQLDLLRRRRRRWGWPRLVAAAVLGPLASLIAVGWSQSRTGWISLVAAAVVFVLPWRHDRYGVLAAAATAGVVVLMVLPPLVSTNPLAFNGRGVAWAVARWVIEQDPLLGWGTYAFSRDFWQVYGAEFPFAYWPPVHAHNVVLQAGALLGLVGVAITVGALVCFIVAATAARRLDRGLTFALLLGVAASAGVEAAFGVGLSGAVYLPVILLGGAVGAALGRVRSQGTESASRGPTPGVDTHPPVSAR